MKIACMQPYFLPYIGYWQLIHAVDKFVILDDVQFITKGWINRNKIIVNSKEQWITVPIINANKNRIINEIKICDKNQWLPKFKRSIRYNFSKSIFFKDAHEILNKIMDYEDNNLCNFLIHSISIICEYLGIKTEILIASNFCPKEELQGQSRILNICTTLCASTYINLSGGKGLYDSSSFSEEGIGLHFLEQKNLDEYICSIAQILFKKNKQDIKADLYKFELI